MLYPACWVSWRKMDIVLNLSWSMETCLSFKHSAERRWSGNAGSDSDTGKPIIYDPSAFFGHNEYEIGIQKVHLN